MANAAGGRRVKSSNMWRGRATDDSVNSSVFGTVSLRDYVRFSDIHTRHHCRQMDAR